MSKLFQADARCWCGNQIKVAYTERLDVIVNRLDCGCGRKDFPRSVRFSIDDGDTGDEQWFSVRGNEQAERAAKSKSLLACLDKIALKDRLTGLHQSDRAAMESALIAPGSELQSYTQGQDGDIPPGPPQ